MTTFLTVLGILLGWSMMALVVGTLLVVVFCYSDAKNKKREESIKTPITLMDVLREMNGELILPVALLCFFLWWLIVVPLIIVLIFQIYDLHNRIIIYDENWFKKKEGK